MPAPFISSYWIRFFCFVLSVSISFDLFLKCYSVTLNCFLVFVPTTHRCDTVLHTIDSVHKATPAPLFTFYMCFASNFRLSFFQMNFKSFAWIYNNPSSLGYHSTAFIFVYLFCENCFFFRLPSSHPQITLFLVIQILFVV